jgi:hypothetical protein
METLALWAILTMQWPNLPSITYVTPQTWDECMATKTKLQHMEPGMPESKSEAVGEL